MEGVTAADWFARGPLPGIQMMLRPSMPSSVAALLGLTQRAGSVRAARGLIGALTWALSSNSPSERAARLRLGLPPA